MTFPIGGPTVGKYGRRETAYVHRDMLTLLRATPVWASDAPKAVQRELIAWTERMIRLIAPHTPAESYQNFPNRSIADWQREYYAENVARLVRVKRKYDRHNLFATLRASRPTHDRGAIPYATSPGPAGLSLGPLGEAQASLNLGC